VKTLQRAGVKESFEDSKIKSSEGTTLLRALAELRVEEFAEERRSKGRGLWNLGNSSKTEGKRKKLRGSNNSRQIGLKRGSGSLICHDQEERTGGGDR
jgi:hypothetical protein